MKKGLLTAAVAAIALAVASPLAINAESADSPDGQIVLEEVAENGGIKKGDSSTTVDEKWGTSIGAGYEVVWVGDAYVTPEGAKNVTSLTVAASKYGGTLIVHKGTSTIDGPAASITLKADNLSPVIVLAKTSGSSNGSNNGNKKNSPNTGDSGNALWAGALIISVLCAGAAIVMNRRNA